jgi:hypothetical protein
MLTADCVRVIGYEVWRESGGIVRHLVKSLDAECEGNTIQQSAVTSNGLQCGINRNIVWLFERHKHSPDRTP